jgi:hypothetical protein
MANPEILDGPTPFGGVRLELYILDGGKVITRELAKDGSLISETFGSMVSDNSGNRLK